MIHPPGRTVLRVLVTGGGTGGHTYPALTTIRALQARLAVTGTRVDLLWVGVAHGLEAQVAAAEGIRFLAVNTGKVRRSPNRRELAANRVDAFRVPVGIGRAIAVVSGFDPDVVFCTGGYVAVPVGVAARLLRRPLLVHEQTYALGLANRLLVRLADRVLLSHASSVEHLSASGRRRAIVTGNPIRAELLTGDRQRALSTLQLPADVPLVLVTGGAQGARQINQLLLPILADLLAQCTVVHQTGPHDLTTAQQAAAGLPDTLAARYRPVAYLHGELPDVLAAADVVIARSGAGTVAELTALGRPAVLIPLVPTGMDEQRRTATRLVEHGAAVMLTGPDANHDRLRQVVLDLLADPHRRAALGARARELGHPDAAARVVENLLAAARTPGQPGPLLLTKVRQARGDHGD